MKTGDKIGRYELGPPIGEGAMAEVYAAEHPVLNRPVAIKILKKEVCVDHRLVTRFLEDARAAFRLDHPKVVRVLDVDDSEGQPFIVMELVDGAPLDRWAAGRRIGVGEAARIGRDVAQALAAAHAGGLVHRDVKPSNILVDRASGVAKLTDFGAAKRARPEGAQLTEVGQWIGTPRYMAPEQVDGSGVGPRADIFALGATLYEMLAGRPAFEGSAVSTVFHGILFTNPPPLDEIRPDVPAELVELIDQCLAKAQEVRPGSAKEVAKTLERFAADPDDSLSTTRSAQRMPQTPKTEPRPAATATAGGARSGDPAMTAVGAGEAAPPARDTATGPAGEVAVPATGFGPGAGGGRSRLVPIAAGVGLVLVLGIGSWLYFGGQEPEPGPGVAQTGRAPAPPAPVVEPAPAPEPPAPVAEPAPEPPAPEPATAPTSPLETMPEPTPQPTPAPAPEPEQDLAGLEPGPGPTAEPPAPEAVAPAPEPPIPGPVPAPEPAPAPPAEPEALFDLGCRADTPGCQLAERALNTLGRPDVPPPAVRLNRPSGVYLDREYLVITAEAPSTLGGYLFIDVLTDSGDVYHLLPEPLTPANQIEPGGQVQIGVEEADRAPDVRHWQVSGPFGAGYVLATVSEQPLYQGLRPIAEPLAEYEPVLIDALANKGDNRIAIQLERVEFRPAE